MSQPILTSTKAFGIVRSETSWIDTIDLSIGEPKLSHFPKEFYTELASLGSLSNYYPTEGDLELRNLLLKKYFLHSKNLNLLITHGAIGAIDLAIRSLTKYDDEILTPNPGFPPYEKLILINGRKSRRYDLNLFDQNESICFKSISENISSKTRIVIINSPNNPTGRVLTQIDKKNILDLIDQNPQIFFIFDEVYKEFNYCSNDEEFEMIIQQKENCLFVNSFSKTYPLAGSRIGWIAFDKKLSNYLLPIVQNAFGSISSQGQELAKMFLKSNISYFQQYLDAKEIAVKLARELNLNFIFPEGAVFLFIDTKNKNDYEIVEQLKAIGIMASPGSAFGTNGKGFIRISFAVEEVQLKYALIKIAQVINILC